MNLIFRQAGEQDLPAMSLLVNRAFQGVGGQRGWTDEVEVFEGPRVEVSVLRENLERGWHLIMALLNSEPVGCYRLEMRDEHTAHIGMIAVEPSMQKRGIAKELLNHACALSREYGARKLNLSVLQERNELVSYYSRRGFTLTGRSEMFHSTDKRTGTAKTTLTVLEMSRPLGPLE